MIQSLVMELNSACHNSPKCDGIHQSRTEVERDETPHSGDLFVEVSHEDPEWELSSLARLCTSLFPLPSTVKNLYIYE